MVRQLHGSDPDGIRVPTQEMTRTESRPRRSATPPKYDITINPKVVAPKVK